MHRGMQARPLVLALTCVDLLPHLRFVPFLLIYYSVTYLCCAIISYRYITQAVHFIMLVRVLLLTVFDMQWYSDESRSNLGLFGARLQWIRLFFFPLVDKLFPFPQLSSLNIFLWRDVVKEF
jgi:hypothetical protein